MTTRLSARKPDVSLSVKLCRSGGGQFRVKLTRAARLGAQTRAEAYATVSTSPIVPIVTFGGGGGGARGRVALAAPEERRATTRQIFDSAPPQSSHAHKCARKHNRLVGRRR